jgi:hypothetical protein
MLTNTQYMETGGGVCPNCGGGDIEGGYLEVDGISTWCKVTCLDCEATWRDVYELQQYENLEVT